MDTYEIEALIAEADSGDEAAREQLLDLLVSAEVRLAHLGVNPSGWTARALRIDRSAGVQLFELVGWQVSQR